MATARQQTAAKRNIKKAQAKWRSMSISSRSRAQPKGRARQKPGSAGKGAYYHIEVRPKEEFVAFRTQDVGGPGHIQRVAGRRSSGAWATTTWLVSKEDAHLKGRHLEPDTADVRDLLKQLGSEPMLVQGDRFRARPRLNVPESAKPTPAQRRAQQANIKKAQAARRKTAAGRKSK